MKVSPINNYPYVQKGYSVNYSNSVAFGYRDAYIKAFNSTVNQNFCDKLNPKMNNIKLNNILTNLLGALEKFPAVTKSREFDKIRNNFNGLSVANIKRIVKELGVRVGEIRQIVTCQGEQYFNVLNLGPYEVGLFSTSQHDQVVFEFYNPENKEFIGFSLDADGDLAVTEKQARNVFYDMNGEKRYKGKMIGGYDAVNKYSELYDKNGKEPQQSLWQWFLDL